MFCSTDAAAAGGGGSIILLIVSRINVTDKTFKFV
jgi:hypothetical protein